MSIQDTKRPHTLLSVIPSDRSQTISIPLKKKLKKKHKENTALITEIELNLLKTPRQPMSVLEPIIKAYIVKLFKREYARSQLKLKLTKAEFNTLVTNSMDEFLYNKSTGKRAKFIKRDRIRFFAKAIVNGRVKCIGDSFKVSGECTRVSFLNQTRGMVGFILDNLALLNMILSFSKSMVEKFSGSIAPYILSYCAHSLVVGVGVLQIISIYTENQPLQLKHYAQIGFILTMTTLSLVGSCTGFSYFSILSSSLAIFRNILIFSNELNEYLNAEPGSDKQMSHKQTCFSTLSDILLSALAVAVTAVIMLTPWPGTTLTIFIVTITLTKIVWECLPSETKMSIKKTFGFGKKEYDEFLSPPTAQLIEPPEVPQQAIVVAQPLPLDNEKPITTNPKRRSHQKKQALLSSIVVAEPIMGESIEEKCNEKEMNKTEKIDKETNSLENQPINNSDPSI